ncbi:MAG TPA: protease inhibitor I42 family protein [Dehalococcoidales bacterium]|nr:protease inhibitor I42 family protein [Dehalococcoidales bacterium]
MKIKLIMVALAVLLALSLLACSSKSTEIPPGTPDPSTYAAATTVEFYTCNDFATEPNMTDDVVFTVGKGVSIILCSNQTTGFQWNEQAQISDPEVIEQTGHQYSAPSSSKPGAAGTETFNLKGLKKGTATVKLEYSRPWEGGEKAEWTCTLNITVK